VNARSWPSLVLLAALVLATSAAPARAGWYTWVDDSGDKHLVDSPEKVPAKYRSKAHEVGTDASASHDGAHPAPRDTSRDTTHDTSRDTSHDTSRESPPERTQGESPKRSRAAPGDTGSSSSSSTSAERGVTREPSSAGASYWDRLRALKVTKAFPRPSLRAALETIVPEGRLPELGALLLAAVLAVRSGMSFRARSAARALASFRERYGKWAAAPSGRFDERVALGLEGELARVAGWVSAAELGPTTVGTSREVGMGRLVDEGRLDVLTQCLVRPERVAAHMVSLLHRAEGVYRHRARRPWLPRGWLESVLFGPRFLLPSGRGGDGAVRVVLVAYWLYTLAWAVAA